MSILSFLKERLLVSQYTDETKLDALLEEKKACFYLGLDPTAESIHVGHLLPLRVLMKLAQDGQRAIVLLGSATALVGDPSGKSQMRRMLSEKEIADNAQSIKVQITQLFAYHQCEVEIVNNVDWLLSLSYIDLLRTIGVHFSVNKMLSFESYRRRMERGLSFLEFNYQILQAFDYLHLCRKFGCNLQIGGDDQWGNIVAGADLVRRVERKEVYGLTMPLLTTSTGQKMGKTEKGALFLDKNRTSVFEFYQYWRNVTDDDLQRFLLLYTDLPLEETNAFVTRGHENLNRGKEYLAQHLTEFVHGKEAAAEVHQAAKALFSGSGDGISISSGDLEYARLEKEILAVDLFFMSPLCSSKSAARRLVQQGGAKVNDLPIITVDHPISVTDIKNGKITLKAGKKNHFCFTIVNSPS